MEKLFISHKLSLLAKEKGFDETCIAYFDIEEGNKLKMIPQGEEINSFHSNRNKLMIAAPTYMQLFDWFEEKHNIHIDRIWYNDKVTPERWVYHVQHQYAGSTYDEAIQEALKLV